jgi:hypothetical protein
VLGADHARHEDSAAGRIFALLAVGEELSPFVQGVKRLVVLRVIMRRRSATGRRDLSQHGLLDPIRQPFHRPITPFRDFGFDLGEVILG